jgi:DNA-binding NtrC family response regulator
MADGISERCASILLVDDDADVLALLADVVRRAGFDVVTADDGLEAISLLAGSMKFGGLVTDESMPGLSGQALIGKARILRPGLRCLLISGRSGIDREDDFNVLRKPFRAAALAASVRSLVRPF